MNTRTKKELFFLLGGILVPLVLAIVFFLIWMGYTTLSSPSFVGLQNYFRLFLEDKIFGQALWNTILLGSIPVIAAAVIGKLLAVLLGKRGKLAGLLPLGIWLVGFAVIFFTLILPYALYGSLFALVAVTGMESLQTVTCVFVVVAFFVGLGCCYGAFYLTERVKMGGISRILLSVAGVLVAQYWTGFFVNIQMQLVGIASSQYSAHTLLTHIVGAGDTSSAKLMVTPFGIAGFLFQLSGTFLLVLLFWLFDNRRAKWAKNKESTDTTESTDC